MSSAIRCTEIYESVLLSATQGTPLKSPMRPPAARLLVTRDEWGRERFRPHTIISRALLQEMLAQLRPVEIRLRLNAGGVVRKSTSVALHTLSKREVPTHLGASVRSGVVRARCLLLATWHCTKSGERTVLGILTKVPKPTKLRSGINRYWVRVVCVVDPCKNLKQ